jgi:putative nucleotidyltransferase with HDIG domain
MLNNLSQTVLDSVTSISLPPLSQVMVKFLALVEDEQTPLTDLAALVALDPALTAQILTVASYPPYRREASCFSLEQSMAALGMPLLKTIASCLAVQNVQSRSFYERNLDYAGFWCHSLRVAALAKALAKAAGYQDIEEAYLAGLLHDIGQLLLVGGVIDCCDTFSGSFGNETGLAGLTQTLNGIDHALLGAHLVDSWDFPSFMADALLFHQSQSGQIRSADLLCRIVWAAHGLSDSAENIDQSTDSFPGGTEVAAILGVEQAAITIACDSARIWAQERAAFVGVQTQLTEKASPSRRFIYPYLSLPKRDARDASQLQLDALVKTQAVMQSLQQSLLTLSGEAALNSALRETARLLFGLQRPVFFFPLTDRPVLAAATCAGQSPLLKRLEIPLNDYQSLPLQALQTQIPSSSFAESGEPARSLIDIQLARLLGGEGLLCIPMGTVAQQGGVMVFGLTGEQFAGKQRMFDWMTGFARSAKGVLESFRKLQQRDQRLSAELYNQFEQKARKVIHEAVNPLGIINSYLNIFTEKLGDGADAQQELSILKEEIFRVERVIRRLNDQPEQPLLVETVNVNSLIEGMLALYGESLFEIRGIAIDRQLTPGLPSVKADRDSLKQIILNIWKNSAEAMPDGGSFHVSTCEAAQDDADGSLEIRMSDSGPGIPADIKERLFQPLPPDRRPANSGVGLSIVASLVERLGGQISCDSIPGKGTTFIIRLKQA